MENNSIKPAAQKSMFSDSSTVLLFGSNLLTIVLAVSQNWGASTIVWTYWIQSVVIGIFNAARIFSLKKFSTEGLTSGGRRVPETDEGKRSIGIFFILHYGIFHFVYALFLIQSFKNVNWLYLIIGGFIFFMNHQYSYLHNKHEDEAKVPNLGTVMFWPYFRIIPMHLTLGYFVTAKSSGALVAFLLLKTAVDIAMHVIEHRKRVKEVTADTNQ